MISSNMPVTQAAAEAVRAMSNSSGPRSESAGHEQHSEQNVGISERSVSVAAGVVLGLLALTRPVSLRGFLLAGGAAGLIYRGVSGSCGVYKAFGINTNNESDHDSSEASAKPEAYSSRGIHVEQSVSVAKPAQELYAFWRNFENLPRIMDHLNSVIVADEKRSHWSARAPLGYTVEWDAEIINDEPGKLIAWQSVGEAMVDNSGSVRFIERPNGTTDVRVVLDYIPPAGRIGAMVARLFGESPDVQVHGDLRRFKQIMEAGEESTNANGTPRGTCKG